MRVANGPARLTAPAPSVRTLRGYFSALPKMSRTHVIPPDAPRPIATTRTDRVFPWIALLLGSGHLAWMGLAHTLRPEDVFVDGLMIFLPWIGPRGLAFAKGALPFWAAGIIAEKQGLLPLFHSIHTGDMAAFSRALFPAPNGVTWPRWFSHHTSPVLDLFTGASYLLFLYEVLGLGVFFFFKRRERFAPLAWAFLFANAAGAVLYMLFPSAPPWYVMRYGPGPANLHALPSAAGAARFDALLGIHYFRDFYERNSDVFGSMPSMHVAFPLMCTWFTWKDGWRWRIPTIAFTLLVCFSAVYLGHHWIVDVLAGLLISVGACWGAERWFTPKRVPRRQGNES